MKFIALTIKTVFDETECQRARKLRKEDKFLVEFAEKMQRVTHRMPFSQVFGT